MLTLYWPDKTVWMVYKVDDFGWALLFNYYSLHFHQTQLLWEIMKTKNKVSTMKQSFVSTAHRFWSTT
jgi:hypothetical protein